MSSFPEGTVTFLFTDLEGSTKLWEAHPEAMQPALAVHDEILKRAVAGHAGVLIKTTGDGIHAVFAHASDALRAAIAAQHELHNTEWAETGPLVVRMGLHSGEAQYRDGDYYGTALNRAARIMGLGHGGQILLSQATYLLISADFEDLVFRDLGEHQLRGLADPEHLYQVCAPELPVEFPPLDSGTTVPHNLPDQMTSFFGRQKELAEVAELLRDEQVRLVTLTGPGGTGKTRLSLEAARSLLDHFKSGVYFVELAPISDPELVPTTIARTIGLREGGGLPPIENLKTYLKDRNVLLVLDNLEQVIDAAGSLSDILAHAPGLKYLASSRIPLQVRGEYEYFLTPLSLPEGPDSLEALTDSAAVQLFLARGAEVNHAFKLTRDNASAIAEICRRLDGLPLALEIAAARLRMLPPEAILSRLDSSLNLLSRVSRDLPQRQQTMRAAIDWSYDLLEPDAQRLFARLAVFVGGFTFESAETICNPDGALDVLTLIEVLVSNSLVRPVSTLESGPRFDMLQTIRAYALEKLSEQGEFEDLRARHAEYFTRASEQAMYVFFSSRAEEMLKWAELEKDNLRATLAWGTEKPERTPFAARASLGMQWFWYRNGHFHEGREWTGKILYSADSAANPLIRGITNLNYGSMAMWESDLLVAEEFTRKGLEFLSLSEEEMLIGFALMSMGVVQVNRGEDEPAHAGLQQAAAIFHEVDFPWFEATTMVHLANASLGLGRTAEARSWLDKAQVLADSIADPWLSAFTANNQGEVDRVERRFDDARPHYEETHRQFALADAKGDQARLVHTFGYLEMHAGNPDRAQDLFQESLHQFLELGNKRGIVECLAALAGLAARQGHPDWAAPLLDAAERLLASFGAAWWPADRVEIEAFKDLVNKAGKGQFEATIGSTLQDAVTYALNGPSI